MINIHNLIALLYPASVMNSRPVLWFAYRSSKKKITFEDSLLEYNSQGQFYGRCDGVLHFVYKSKLLISKDGNSGSYIRKARVGISAKKWISWLKVLCFPQVLQTFCNRTSETWRTVSSTTTSAYFRFIRHDYPSFKKLLSNNSRVDIFIKQNSLQTKHYIYFWQAPGLCCLECIFYIICFALLLRTFNAWHATTAALHIVIYYVFLIVFQSNSTLCKIWNWSKVIEKHTIN